MNDQRHPATGAGAKRAPDPFVSVVVPVRNGGDELRRLVDALAAQDFPQERFEVVIADDGSMDGAAARLASDNGSVRVLTGRPVNSYAARNRAARTARGEILAFSDHDCTPEPTWLAEGVAALENTGIAAGLIQVVIPARPTVWTLLSADMLFDQQRAVQCGRAMTANLFVRRDTFQALGGFDETLPSGGDFDLAQRHRESGGELAFAPRAVVRHPAADRPSAFLSRIWLTNVCLGRRLSRAAKPPEVATKRSLVPIIGVALERRDRMRPWRLHPERLAAAGLEVRLSHDIRALPLLYLLVPYVIGAAQVYGWCAGVFRRLTFRRSPISQPPHRTATRR